MPDVPMKDSKDSMEAGPNTKPAKGRAVPSWRRERPGKGDSVDPEGGLC